MSMTFAQIVQNRIERVTYPGWPKDAYLKVDYLRDGSVSRVVTLVSPRFQRALGMEIGQQHFDWWNAFGNLDVWEKFTGFPAVGF